VPWEEDCTGVGGARPARTSSSTATSSSASYFAARCSPACSICARSSRPEGEGEMRARRKR
jgi:hypothetical protein